MSVNLTRWQAYAGKSPHWIVTRVEMHAMTGVIVDTLDFSAWTLAKHLQRTGNALPSCLTDTQRAAVAVELARLTDNPTAPPAEQTTPPIILSNPVKIAAGNTVIELLACAPAQLALTDAPENHADILYENFPESQTVVEPAAPLNHADTLTIDANLAALAVALGKEQSFLLREVAANRWRGTGHNTTTRKELHAECQRLGIAISFGAVCAALASDNGVFWREIDGDRIAWHGYRHAPVNAVVEASRRGLQASLANLPGGSPRVLVAPPTCGTGASLRGYLYGVFLSAHQRPELDGMVISRAALAAIFNTDERSIRRWDKHVAGLRITATHGVSTDGELAPEHAYGVLAQTSPDTTQRVFRWRHVNRYTVPEPRRAKRGTAEKIRRAVTRTIDTIPVFQSDADVPMGTSGQIDGVLRRLYFGDSKAVVDAAKVDRKHDVVDAIYHQRLTRTRRGVQLYERTAIDHPRNQLTAAMVTNRAWFRTGELA